MENVEEKFKLALFMVIRNSKVMPVGIKLGKSLKEINQMSYLTMNEVLNSIDYDTARNMYEEGKQ